ncbi:hypothetical protein SpCBS45565_g00144 [Spizellomyces sp. 'palustris']|nr:hypothetical protein SpCBS45565_g00144 [Spizellomyces sp. 'palustris']
MADQAANQAIMLLNAARTLQDIGQRVTVLHQLHEVMKREPALLATFFPIALGLAVDPSADLRVGVLRLIEDTTCRMTVPDEARMLVAARSVEALTFLMTDENPNVIKRIVRCATSIYPFIFKWMCKLPADQATWQGIAGLKVKLFALLGHSNDGVKEGVVRFLHKLIMVQSPKDASVVAIGTDSVSIDLCPPQHPFINVQELNAEAVGLFNRMQSFISIPGVSAGPITANLNCMLGLTKARPQYLQPVLTTLVQWVNTPSTTLTLVQRRSVERTIKIVLMSALRSPAAAPYATVLTDALVKLGTKSHEIQQARRRELKRSAPPSTPEVLSDPKRQRTSGVPQSSTQLDFTWNTTNEAFPQDEALQLATQMLNTINANSLSPNIIAELVVQTLASCTTPRWEQGVMRFKQVSGLVSQPSVQPPVAALNRDPRRDPRMMDAQQFLESTPPALSENENTASTDTSLAKDEELPLKSDIPGDSSLSGREDDENLAKLRAGSPSQMDIMSTDQSEDHLSDLASFESSARAIVLDLSNTDLPELSADERRQLANDAVKRILSLEPTFSSQVAISTVSGAPGAQSSGQSSAGPFSLSAAKSGWMLVLCRLTTALSDGHPVASESEETNTGSGRVSDVVKGIIMESLLEDFRGRLELAVIWFHHLWLEDEHRTRAQNAESLDASSKQYPIWFHRILDKISTTLDPKDKTFAKFLIDVPEVTEEAIHRVVKGYCDDHERMQLGLFTLQGLINHRPAVRAECLKLLLEYALHPTRLTRSTAIVMCKRFFTDHRTIGPKVEEFALEAIRALLGPPEVGVVHSDSTEQGDHNGVQEDKDGEDEDMGVKEEKDGHMDAERRTSNGDITPDDWKEDDVVRRLELYFALCSKKHELLLELFKLYKDFHTSVQRAVRKNIPPLIKALSAQPARLLPIIRAFPEGSDWLVLRMVTTMTEKHPPSPQLVSAVWNAFAQKDLDARFLIPILSGLGRPKILQYLPRIVQLLDGSDKQRTLVKDAFLRLVDSPSLQNAAAASAGTGVGPAVSTNGGDRAAQPGGGGAGPPLTPSELLVALHNMEDTVGLKRAVEATTICFTCQNVFKGEVLAVVLQQLVDQSKLPTLFMRTVIQSVNQYPALVNFVTNILLKLINKKVWSAPKLWEGFIRCCLIIFPASMQVLQSLPRPHVADALKRSPKLKSALQAHIAQLEPEQKARREIQIFVSLVESGAPAEMEQVGTEHEPKQEMVEVKDEGNDEKR